MDTYILEKVKLIVQLCCYCYIFEQNIIVIMIVNLERISYQLIVEISPNHEWECLERYCIEHNTTIQTIL